MSALRQLYGNFILEWYEVDSHNEMEEILCKSCYDKYDAPMPEDDNSYVILKLKTSCDTKWFGIGICYSGYEAPALICGSTLDTITLLYNNHIINFDIVSKSEVFHFQTELPIRFAKYHKNNIVIITEASILQINLKGKILIRKNMDAIMNYCIEEDHILYETDSNSGIFMIQEINNN